MQFVAYEISDVVRVRLEFGRGERLLAGLPRRSEESRLVLARLRNVRLSDGRRRLYDETDENSNGLLSRRYDLLLYAYGPSR